MNEAMDISGVMNLPFLARTVPADTPAEVVRLMKMQLVHEFSFRARILATSPASAERSALTREMYERTYQIQKQIRLLQGDKYGNCQDIRDKSLSARSYTRLQPTGHCLEIGCGSGSLCLALAQCGWRVQGIDVVAGSEWGKISAAVLGSIKLEVRDFVTDGISCGTDFDLVVLEGCLEHMAPGDYERSLKLAFEVLRPGGRIAIDIPSPLTGPHDCTIDFRRRGEPALGGHFSERTLIRLVMDLHAAGFKDYLTVISGGAFAGARHGWSKLWLLKALVSECGFRTIPSWLWSDDTFEFFVPHCLSARKP